LDRTRHRLAETQQSARKPAIILKIHLYRNLHFKSPDRVKVTREQPKIGAPRSKWPEPNRITAISEAGIGKQPKVVPQSLLRRGPTRDGGLVMGACATGVKKRLFKITSGICTDGYVWAAVIGYSE
jgi:hypothetical protein